jgi:thymidylate synthase (FAD)
MALGMSDKQVLDKGFVRLIETMGTDLSIVQAARVSYDSGSKGVESDTKLLRYLMKHKHTSPFEMCEIKLHIKAPIFVARQWVRHRTASWNEISGRYTEIKEEYYLPELSSILGQSKSNKQSREAVLSIGEQSLARHWIDENSKDAISKYRALLNLGVARELARVVLPVNFYTEWYWKIDLHNLMGFLRQRMDSHAQYEIREYANAISEIIQEWVPITHTAFVDSMSGDL